MWYGLWYGEFFILTFIEAVLIFDMFLRVKEPDISERQKKLIAAAAEGALGVCLMHIYVLERRYRYLLVCTMAIDSSNGCADICNLRTTLIIKGFPLLENGSYKGKLISAFLLFFEHRINEIQ